MKSMLLIGLNNFGSLLAKKYCEEGHQLMAIDKDETKVENILPYVTDAQIGDSTNEIFLKSLGINNFDVCIVAIVNDFQASLETTSLLKEFGAKLVVSRADTEKQAKFLLSNGADEVINPEKQMAEWAAVRYASNHILDYIRLDGDHAIFEVKVPEECNGKTVGQIDIRKKYGINIMALIEDGKMNLPVLPETVLNSHETMLVLGAQKAIQKCFRI